MSEPVTCEQCEFYIAPTTAELLRGTCTFHRAYNTDPQYPPRVTPACRFLKRKDQDLE